MDGINLAMMVVGKKNREGDFPGERPARKDERENKKKQTRNKAKPI
jgi:hypothetical protein